MIKKEEILVTGAAGFIGFHTCIKLLRQGKSIIGFDNINSYYDVELKESRLQELKRISKEENLSWQFVKGGLEDKITLLLKQLNQLKQDDPGQLERPME